MKNFLLAIDPSDREDAVGWVILNGKEIVEYGLESPSTMAFKIKESIGYVDAVAVEEVVNRGVANKHILNTNNWEGYYRGICDSYNIPYYRFSSDIVRTYLCGRPNSDDSEVVYTMLLRYGDKFKAQNEKTLSQHPTFTKRHPKLNLGGKDRKLLVSHTWQALALGTYVVENLLDISSLKN